MALQQGPYFLPHGTVLFAIFYLVLMGGEGSAVLLKLRGFVVLPAPGGWLVDLSRSPTAHRGSKQVTALL